MGKIYGMAPSTIIYLGQLTADAAKLLSARSWRAAEAHHETLGMDQGAAPAADILAKPVEANALVELAARHVLSRPWFKRVWVLQELVLSKIPWIQCGRQRVRWDDFCPFLLAEFKLGTATLPNEYRTWISLLDDMNETRNIRARGDGKSLCDVLKMRRGFGVADPRDYVYANLSIISDLRRVGEYLDVDYGDSVQAVFSRMAIYILEKEGIKGLMAQVQDMHPEERLQGLPSWAPEWQCLAPNLTNHIRDQPKSVLGKHHVLSIGGVPSILAHTGYDVGIISSVSAVLPLNRNTVNTLLSRERYSYVRQRLLNMYDVILKATGPIDEVDNDYVLVSGNPLFPQGCETRHKSLCQALGREWVRFFENLNRQLNKELMGDEAFTAMFSLWISAQAHIHRAFLNFTFSTGLGTERSICHGIPYLLERYLEFKTDDCLSGRRLAVTDTGHCVLVPKQARMGDAVVLLGDPTARRPMTLPLLVVRRKEVAGSQPVNATIMKALHEHKLVRRFNHLFRPLQWPDYLAEEAECVEHYSLVGQGYVDHNSNVASPLPKKEQMHVFALH